MPRSHQLLLLSWEGRQEAKQEMPTAMLSFTHELAASSGGILSEASSRIAEKSNRAQRRGGGVLESATHLATA